MFSQTVISGNRASDWKIIAVGRWFGPSPFMSRPPISTRPSVGSMKPAIIRRIVVLPQPEGPRIEKNSPSRTLKVTSLTARVVPKVMPMPDSSTEWDMETP
jgi:hypothetical protein